MSSTRTATCAKEVRIILVTMVGALINPAAARTTAALATAVQATTVRENGAAHHATSSYWWNSVVNTRRRGQHATTNVEPYSLEVFCGSSF